MSVKVTNEQRKSILLDPRSNKLVAEDLGLTEMYVYMLRSDSISSYAKNFRKALTDEEYAIFLWATQSRKFAKRLSRFNKSLSSEEVALLVDKEYPRPT